MTSTTSDLILLTIGGFGILVALTLFGELIRHRQPSGTENPVLETYMTRVESWWGMVIFISLALISGRLAKSIFHSLKGS